MEKHRGSTRVVYVFPSVGIAVKFARIANPLFVLSDAEMIRKARGRHAAWQYLRTSMRARRFSPLFQVLGGLAANVGEWWFYVRTRHPLLAATYFTLGFVNVQRAVRPLPEEAANGWGDALVRCLGIDSLFELGDPHAFQAGNFGVEHGRPSVVDYGERDMRRAVERYGDRLLVATELVSAP